MTHEEGYQMFLDSILGTDSIKIPLNGNRNDVIGAINHAGEFQTFKANFKSRIDKLSKIYRNTTSYQTLLNTIKQVADDKNWDGAYAELTALDVLSSSYLAGKIELDITLPGKESFALEWGKQKTNEDGHWIDYDAYFDVKILSDPVEAILKNIINEAHKKMNNKGCCSVLVGNAKDNGGTLYKNNFHAILGELCDGMKAKSKFVKSSVIPELCFNIDWDLRVNSAISTYNPYRHAENTKNLVLERYTYKFMKRKPFFLVFVNFPWFNQVINDFDGMNEVYYRAIARRTFCQYLHSNTKMSDISEKYRGKEYARTVVKYLSGIIFIDDDSIKSNEHSCYIYMNPNRKNKQSLIEEYLQSIANLSKKGIFDDFAYDNY